MIRIVGLALVLALGTTLAYAEDDDKVPEAEMAKVTAAMADLGCKDPEGVKKEEEGIYEIDDAKCKMARWTSSSTRTSLLSSSRATDLNGRMLGPEACQGEPVRRRLAFAATLAGKSGGTPLPSASTLR
jgi:hypothetical protein